LSKERFDKDIELAKLQYKISDTHAKYYAIIVTLVAGMLSVALLDFLPLSAGDENYLIITQVVLVCAIAVVVIRLAFKQREIRKDFENIYDGKRIEC
jgi:L-asparagine transporter-like permease